ncbi:MAG: SGNH/GDSL hydrolase family protein [Anaerolineales bacterium]|nr:SGNH/GDSL hydrolase family protein [Anaerolineales bacterium]
MSSKGWRLIRNVLIKALALFAALNLLFAFVEVVPLLGRLSLYNSVFPGRLRFPYGDDPSESYNLTLTQIDAMFAAHAIQTAEDDEYRIFLIGDSSIWGFLQPAGETLAGQINRLELHTEDGRPVRAYNFGYPTMAWLKDLLLLNRAMTFEPDLLLWFVTLESGTDSKQLDAPLVQYNAGEVQALIERFSLDQDPADPRLIEETFWDRTIIGQRRVLADLLRHQMLGVLWAATSLDHVVPEVFAERMEDLDPEIAFQTIEPQDWDDGFFAFDVLEAGFEAAGAVPMVLINEPMFISAGENSDIRYNFYYPRWVYDRYREQLGEICEQQDWLCVDLWDLLPGELYTDSAIHYTPEGAQRIALEMAPLLETLIHPQR